MTRRDKIINVLILPVLFLAFFLSKAEAQTWDRNNLSWVAPTSCTNDQPIANCAVTGYRIERANTGSGTYTAVGTSTTTSFSHTAIAGTNCYRVVALSAQGDSGPSNVHCVTNTPPAGPPNPPTNLRVTQTTVMSVRPDYDRLVFVTSQEVGRIPVGTDCDQNRSLGDGWYGVPRESVTWTGSNRPANVVARCAQSSQS